MPFGHKADILSALTGESWWLAPGFYQDDSKLSLASQRAGGFSTKGGRGATETNRFWLTTPIRLLITPHWAETSCRSTPGADPVQKGLQACLQELSLSGVHDAESRHELSLQPCAALVYRVGAHLPSSSPYDRSGCLRIGAVSPAVYQLMRCAELTAACRASSSP